MKALERNILYTLLCVPVLFSTAYAGEQAAGEVDSSAQIDSLFDSVAQADAPGASVIVIQDGRILHKKGYGMANLEHGVPNTPQTKFRIGSMTKSFTAIAIMQLHEEGYLNIDDSIVKYLPDHPNGERITIRHLLTHTSGMLESVDEPLYSNPGDSLNYSNLGYCLLGRIIEKVSGKTYEEYLKESIFLPLNMVNSGYDHHSEVLRHRASGYSTGGDGKFANAEYIDMSEPYAAGGLYSTVEDMYLWDQALYTDKLVEPSILQQAFEPVRLNDGREGGYGLGWMISQNRGLKQVSHGGDISGFNSFIARFPDQRFTVVVLSNVSMHAPGPVPTAGAVAYRIATMYLSDLMQPEERRVEIKLDPRIYDSYIGEYKLHAPEAITNVSGGIFTVTKEDGRLFSATKQGKAEMVPESETVFYSSEYSSRITFLKNDEGEVTGLIINIMGLREFRAQKIRMTERQDEARK